MLALRGIREFLLIAVKLFLFNVFSLRNKRRYFSLKGHLMIWAARTGLYERRDIRALGKFVKIGDEAIDVGANFGAYTDALARHVGPEGRVFAFEPLPALHAFLSLRFKDQSNVVLFPAALSDAPSESGEMRIPRLRGGLLEPALASLEADERKDFESIAIAVRTLDQFGERFRKISFIKIDVEGREMRVLAGASETIRKHRPIIQLETDKIDQGELSLWLKAHRYLASVDSSGSPNTVLSPLGEEDQGMFRKDLGTPATGSGA